MYGLRFAVSVLLPFLEGLERYGVAGHARIKVRREREREREKKKKKRSLNPKPQTLSHKPYTLECVLPGLGFMGLGFGACGVCRVYI